MNPQMQFNLPHIIGQAVDVTNYTTLQQQLHGYGNINTFSGMGNIGVATPSTGTHSVTVQNVEMPSGHSSSGSGMVTVGYAPQGQQQPALVQSYHAVFKSMTVAHVAPQVPAAHQVQYISYEAPCVAIRPQTHCQVAHQLPPPATISAQVPVKYSSGSVSFQAVNSSAVPFSCSSTTLEEEAADGDFGGSSEVLPKVKKKRRKEGISAKVDRKSRRNRGEAYISASGKLVKAKQYIDKDCACIGKCLLKLGTVADREGIFKRFWNIGNFSQQNVYLTQNVTLVPRREKKSKGHTMEVDGKNLKTVKRLYCVRLLYSKKPVRVCKAMFLNLHGVSNGRLNRVLQAVNCELPYALQDRRGQHAPSNKTSEDDIRFAAEHIASARQGDKSEISPSVCMQLQELAQSQLTATEIPVRSAKEMSVKKMYSLYERHCKEEGRLPVSLWVYRRIEKNKFSQENVDRTNKILPNTDFECDKTCTTRVMCVNSENKILTVNHMNAYSNNDNDSNSNRDHQETPSNHKNHTLSVATVSKKSGDYKMIMTREERKMKRNSGNSYYTASGKYKDEKCYVDKECGCKYRCIPTLGTLERRKKIFADFWKLADFSKQNAYIAEKVVLAPVTQKCGKKPPAMQKCGTRASEKFVKTCSRVYYVQVQEGEDVIRVCKTAFLQLHGVSNGRVDRVLQAVACESPFALQDRRGHHSPKNKTGDEDLNFASSHIRSFLKELPSSDECGATKLYLPHDLTIQKMYCLYKENCLQSGRTPVGCFVYRKIVKERFDCCIRSPANKTPEEDLAYAYEHINMCTNDLSVLEVTADPKVQQANASAFADPELQQASATSPISDTSVKKLHRDYIQKCVQEARKPVGIDVYRKIFNSRIDVEKNSR